MAKVHRIVVQIPESVKVQLDEERDQGRSTAWVVREALKRYFNPSPMKPTKRKPS